VALDLVGSNLAARLNIGADGLSHRCHRSLSQNTRDASNDAEQPQ
jgi:hypothetical protein